MPSYVSNEILPYMSPQKLIRVLLFKLSRYDQHSPQAAVLCS